jgi:murein DD-endopeptidase MepM/ murein hydrolase activator NlpD
MTEGRIVFYIRMHPLNRAAGVALGFVLLGGRAATDLPAVRTRSKMAASPNAGPEGVSALCPPFTLPDDDACVPIPPGDALGVEALTAIPGAHHDKRGRLESYDQIPRRPDRPAAYDAYRYPIPVPEGNLAMSGYDLDLPEADQRRGRKFSHVGHGGLDLAAPRGTPVQLVKLEHQEGDAEVLFVGKLFGNTVVTRHALREGGRLRDYAVIFGHLERPAPGLETGRPSLAEGAVIGYVGDSSSPGIVHLHFEVRRVREGIDAGKVASDRLVANDVSVVCDPRNVLPRR